MVALALVAACAPAYSPAPSSGSAPPPDGPHAEARGRLLEAINADRAAAGLAAVNLDSLATVVAQTHAEAMAVGGFLSHYGLDGTAPYERLGEAGGTAHVMENLFRWQRRPGAGPAADPWVRFDIRQAQAWLMDSPGHRAAILDDHRTGVGLGIAVDRTGGAIYVVQDFVARWAQIDAPRLAWRRAQPAAQISGRLLADGLRPLLVVIRFEPRPRSWQKGSGAPPRGAYADGTGAGTIVPPWAIEWRPAERSFTAHFPPGRASRPGRWYGVLYVAPERVAASAVARRSVSTEDGWPGATFLIDLL